MKGSNKSLLCENCGRQGKRFKRLADEYVVMPQSDHP